MTKYQKLKQFILSDYPELFWREVPASEFNAYNQIDYTGRVQNGIVIEYRPEHFNNPELFPATAHELGHYLSYREGYHTLELIRASDRKEMGVPLSAREKELIIGEEIRASEMGTQYALQHGLNVSKSDMNQMRIAANTYRRKLHQ